MSGANVHDVKLLPATLDQVVRARPASRLKKPQRLGADAGAARNPSHGEIVYAYYNNHWAGFGPGSIALFCKLWNRVE